MELVIAASYPIANRSGLFAVLHPKVAQAFRDGYMKLFERGGEIVVETITRSRRPLTFYDPDYRLVFFAIDQNGNLVTEIGG